MSGLHNDGEEEAYQLLETKGYWRGEKYTY